MMRWFLGVPDRGEASPVPGGALEGEGLLASERSLAEVQRVADIGSWEWDLKTGEVRWSRQKYAIYGIDPDTFVPSVAALRSAVHPDDRERVEEKIRQVVSTGAPIDIEFRILAPDGTPTPGYTRTTGSDWKGCATAEPEARSAWNASLSSLTGR